MHSPGLKFHQPDLGHSEVDGRQALKVYERTRGAGLKPNVSLVIEALRECSRCRDLRTGRRLHRECREGNINIFVANTLVDMYAKCGSVEEACQVFERMHHRNVVSWNTVIMRVAQHGDGELALRLYSRMQDDGFKPDSRTFVAALKACASLASRTNSSQQDKLRYLERGRGIHREAAKRGDDLDIFVANTLIDMYAKFGSMEESLQVFKRMKKRTVVSWNAIIMGFSQNGQPELALEYFRRIKEDGFAADALTFVAVLTACSGLDDIINAEDGKITIPASLKMAEALHAQAEAAGHLGNMFVANTLVDVYARCGRLMEARRVFDQMQRHDVTSWNVVILRYGENGEERIALQLFERMLDEGSVPDARTYVAVLKACAGLASKEVEGKVVRMESLEKGMAIHCLAFRSGFESDVFVNNTLVDMYSSCGSIDDARRVFEGMRRRNTVSWNVILTAYAQSGPCEEAMETFARMQDEGFEPDSRTYVVAINACTGLEAKEPSRLLDGTLVKLSCLEKGMAIHARLAERGFDKQENFVGNALIDMYSKFGSMEDAARVFERMHRHSVISWNSIITGYAQTRHPEMALLTFSQMIGAGYKPAVLSFVAALKACGSLASLRVAKEVHAKVCAAGLEREVFVATSLVDAYGKCGSMADAQRVFDASPTRKLVTWNALLVGYCQQGDDVQASAMFQALEDEDIVPDAITFLALLTACCQAGLVEKAKHLFETMVKDYGVVPGVEHYTCMVDLFGRTNHPDEAIAMVKKLPVKPDATLWTTLLDACQKWKNVEAAKLVFAALIEMDNGGSMPYVLMGNAIALSDKRGQG